MIAEILLPIPLNKLFSYSIPRNVDKIEIGQIVEVDFNNKKKIGVVWSFTEINKFERKIKSINKVFSGITLPLELIKSTSFIANYSCNHVSLIVKHILSCFSEKFDNNYIQEFKTKKFCGLNNNLNYQLDLNKIQRKASTEIMQFGFKKFNVVLLEGVTGSGKTRVYMNSIYDAIKNNLQCIVLVPEIILTKQWIDEFSKEFLFSPEIFHSSLKKTEKSKIWLGVYLGKINLIVGTRSALFLPFKRLGLIVVDEEHDISYKQEENVIFNARDLAVVRAKNSNCQIILTSATPSIETIFNCKNKKYNKVVINKRVNDVSSPKIEIIDMRKEEERKNLWISKTLEFEINKSIKLKKQSLIFLNKRGYAATIICKKCGYSEICEKCDFPMVLHKNLEHKDLNVLICHYCDNKKKLSETCQKCKSKNSMLAIGPGIQKIYEIAQGLFPKAKICIISSDHAKNKKEFANNLKLIMSNQIDIIIGTQMTSKGHHFPNLRTVGILNVDNLLRSVDIRSAEKTFQLITQVSGRAGRENSDGRVLIQTYDPKNKVLEVITDMNNDKFFELELRQRKSYNHPPYSNMISIIIQGKKENQVISKSKLIEGFLLKSIDKANIFGPSPALIHKIRNNFRWRILIKSDKDKKKLADLKAKLLRITSTKDLNIKLDVDPLNFK